MMLGTVVPRPPLVAAEAGGQRVLVLAGPIHTDIAIPLDAMSRERFAFLREAGMPLDDPAARWLLFGWGGRAFYLETPTWRDLRPGPAARALTADRAVLHVDVLGELAVPQEGLRAYDVDTAARERLERAILVTFDLEEGDPVAIPDKGYGASDRFFEADGWFNVLLGCNTWTAAMLREAGLTTGWWTPLPATLLWSLDLTE